MVLEIKVAQNDPKNIIVSIIDHITVFGPVYVDFKIWRYGRCPTDLNYDGSSQPEIMGGNKQADADFETDSNF